MTPGGVAIEHAGEALALLPARAAWWGRERTLFIADVHIGKAAAFRALGVPAPEAVTRADLARLSGLVDALGAARLVVLGDLLHARAGRTPAPMDALASWRERHARLDVMLVRGNHDRSAGPLPEGLAIRETEPGVAMGPFTLVHDPREAAGADAALAGHVHPAARLSDAAWKRTALRAPCFWLSAGALVLPAFGGFTGAAVIRAAAGDRVFAVGPESVMDVTAACVRADRSRQT